MAVQYLHKFAPRSNFLFIHQLFCSIVGVRQQIIVIGSKVYFMSLGFTISPYGLTIQGEIMEKHKVEKRGEHHSEMIISSLKFHRNLVTISASTGHYLVQT